MTAVSVYAADLDGDGDMDVLSASTKHDQIEWYENQGGGVFGSPRPITIEADLPRMVCAMDMDGDGDEDFLSISYGDGKTAWYENLGGGVFGRQRLISKKRKSGPSSLHTADLDGDGDADILVATAWDGRLTWYENQGGGVFGGRQVISLDAPGASSIFAADLDGDGDADVLSAANYGFGGVGWHENQGNGRFGPLEVISLPGQSRAVCVFATDLDGDGDPDVIAASQLSGKVVWYPNLGGGAFGDLQLITADAESVRAVYATDLDGDGDVDVLSASAYDDKIAWYENEGGGTFGAQQVITTNAKFAVSVYAADLDGDGDPDVLSASSFDNTIAWYENRMNPDCNGNGIPDDQEIGADPSRDWNGDGVLDECVASNYCTAVPNVTNLPGVMSVAGSPLIANNNFTLTASQLPPNDWGFFLMAGSQGLIASPGGSVGNLCLGTPIYRFVKPPTGQVLSTGPGGSFSFRPDLTNLPQGVAFQIGETWNFQAWFRDWYGTTSNFTDGFAVMFR